MAPELIERFHFALLTKPDAAASLYHEIIDAEVNKMVRPVVVERTEVERREATSRQILLQQAIQRSKLRPFATTLEVREFLRFRAVESAGWRLLTLWQAGSSDALSRFVEIFEPMLHRSIRSAHGAISDADEIASQEWLRFVERPTLMQPEQGSLHGHIRTLARRLSMELMRRRQLPRPLQGAITFDDVERNLAERVDLKQALGSFNQADRHLLEQHYIVGRTILEIAEALGQSPSSVFNHIQHARKALRDAMPSDQPSVPSVDTDSNVRFTVYCPKVLMLEKWYTVLVYVHIPSAIAEVEAHSLTRTGNSMAEFAHEQDEARCTIERGAEITILPELPHCIVNPPSARVLWLEDWHAVEFRLSAPATILTSVDAGEKIRGRIGFYVGPVLIAEISLLLDVAGTENHPLEPAGVYSTVKPYQAVFVSYSHKDSAVVEQL